MTSTTALPAHVDVVVIGGGVIGASVAAHLAAFSGTSVLLAERSKLGSGTSWHAAGNMETYRADPLMMDLVRYGTELFQTLEAESGVAFGWRQTGRVFYATEPAWVDWYRGVPARSRLRGVESHFLSPAEIAQRLPIINGEGLLGGLWVPSDGRVDPTNLATAFARLAQKRGAQLAEDLPIDEILTEGGRVRGVRTPGGDIACDAVVVAGGLWSDRITRSCGVRLPLMALHHLYIVTKPVAAIPREMPLFLSYDEQTYGREDVGGLLVGVLDDDAIPIEVDELPADFSFGLLPERWDQMERYLPMLWRRFPLLETAEVRTLLNGPESFTPDGRMLLGETGQVQGLFVAAGMNSSGIALSAGVGKVMAEWVVEGRSSLDVNPLDLARFSPAQGNRRYLRARISQVPGAMCRLPQPGGDRVAPRGLRRSPCHALWLDHGAEMAATVCGHERPAWFSTGQAQDWQSAVTAEVEAARHATALLDRSAMMKLELVGPAALELPHTLALGEDCGLLLAPPEEAGAIGAACARLAGTTAIDRGTGLAVLDLLGPEATAMLRAMSDLAEPGQLEIGQIYAAELHLADGWVTPIASGWRLIMPSDQAPSVAQALLAAGARPIGELAAETLRVIAGEPAWGSESGAFRPTRAVPASLASNTAGSLKGEPLVAGGVLAGHVTSSAWVPVMGRLHLLVEIDGGAEGPVTLADGREVVQQEPLAATAEPEA